MYYKFEETVPKIPSHRMLAIRRGARENILTLLDRRGSREVHREDSAASHSRQPVSQFAPLSRASGSRWLSNGCCCRRSRTKSGRRFAERAEAEAIKVFEENLRTLLLAPPAGPIGVMGIDPGQRTGCKIAVVDQTGKFLENQTIHPTEPKKDLEGAEKTLVGSGPEAQRARHRDRQRNGIARRRKRLCDRLLKRTSSISSSSS